MSKNNISLHSNFQENNRGLAFSLKVMYYGIRGEGKGGRRKGEGMWEGMGGGE